MSFHLTLHKYPTNKKTVITKATTPKKRFHLLWKPALKASDVPVKLVGCWTLLERKIHWIFFFFFPKKEVSLAQHHWNGVRNHSVINLLFNMVIICSLLYSFSLRDSILENSANIKQSLIKRFSDPSELDRKVRRSENCEMLSTQNHNWVWWDKVVSSHRKGLQNPSASCHQGNNSAWLPWVLNGCFALWPDFLRDNKELFLCQ